MEKDKVLLDSKLSIFLEILRSDVFQSISQRKREQFGTNTSENLEFLLTFLKNRAVHENSKKLQLDLQSARDQFQRTIQDPPRNVCEPKNVAIDGTYFDYF